MCFFGRIGRNFHQNILKPLGKWLLRESEAVPAQLAEYVDAETWCRLSRDRREGLT
jgi:hypothetical protein